MMRPNDIVRMAEEIHREGWSIDYIRCERRGNARWGVLYGINDQLPLGEGDDDRVVIDRRNCPDGVSIYGFERPKDLEMIVCCSEEQVETMLQHAAHEGESFDLVRTDGESPDYPHWATKPMKWNRNWAKVDGRWCMSADHKIILGTNGKAIRI